MLNALRYADDDETFQLGGLSHSVKSLPVSLLRFAWCIPPRPSKHDIKNLKMWDYSYFEVKRYDGDELITSANYNHPPQTVGVTSKIWGGVMSASVGDVQSVRMNQSNAVYNIPLFAVPKVEQSPTGSCGSVSISQGSIWVGIGGYENPALLQDGILMSVKCTGLNEPPFYQLGFVAQFLPAEQGASNIPFPVQIRSTDLVNTSVYWKPDGNGNPATVYYSVIDVTQSVGRQYEDANPGGVLIASSAEAVGEAPEINGGVIAVYPAINPGKNGQSTPFTFQSTLTSTDATGNNTYPIGSTFTAKLNGTSVKFLGLTLSTDYQYVSGMTNPAFTNQLGTYDDATKIGGFKLKLVE